MDPTQKRAPQGRPFNTTSPLGQWMVAERCGVRDLSRKSGVNERTISNYLARRTKILDAHTVIFTRVTGLSAGALNAYQLASEDPTGAATVTVERPAAPSRSALVSGFKRRSA